MPQTTGSLLKGKPIVDVAITDAMPTPNPVSPLQIPTRHSLKSYRALLDTGADITCLCDHVVLECNLRPYGIVNMTSGNGSNLHKSYIIQLGIWCQDRSDFEGEDQISRTLFQLPEPLEAAVIRDNMWFDIILGTDILSEHELSFARGGEFTLRLG